MSSPVSDDEALGFIRDQIDTVPHLEALLLLAETPPRLWTIQQVADRIYIRHDRAAEVLQDLARRRLLQVEEAAEVCYIYEPDENLRTLIRCVSDLYRRELVRVTSLIHSKASASVREFAKAFKFTKGDH